MSAPGNRLSVSSSPLDGEASGADRSHQRSVEERVQLFLAGAVLDLNLQVVTIHQEDIEVVVSAGVEHRGPDGAKCLRVGAVLGDVDLLVGFVCVGQLDTNTDEPDVRSVVVENHPRKRGSVDCLDDFLHHLDGVARGDFLAAGSLKTVVRELDGTVDHRDPLELLDEHAQARWKAAWVEGVLAVAERIHGERSRAEALTQKLDGQSAAERTVVACLDDEIFHPCFLLRVGRASVFYEVKRLTS